MERRGDRIINMWGNWKSKVKKRMETWRRRKRGRNFGGVVEMVAVGSEYGLRVRQVRHCCGDCDNGFFKFFV